MQGWTLTGCFFDGGRTYSTWKAIFRKGEYVAYIEIPGTNALTPKTQAMEQAQGLKWSW